MVPGAAFLVLFFSSALCATINDAGLTMLKGFESWQSCWYRDPVGLPTIGYGHLITAGDPYREGTCLTMQEGTDLLRRDLSSFESCVTRYISVPLNGNQFSALVDFSFNVGCGGFQNSDLRTNLNRGDYGSVCTQLRRWVYGGGKVLPGLQRRRDAECNLFNSGAPSSGPSPVPTPTPTPSPPTSGGRSCTSTTSWLNVRSNPSTSATVINHLVLSQTVTISETTNAGGMTWGHISGGSGGWIALQYTSCGAGSFSHENDYSGDYSEEGAYFHDGNAAGSGLYQSNEYIVVEDYETGDIYGLSNPNAIPGYGVALIVVGSIMLALGLVIVGVMIGRLTKSSVVDRV